MMKMLFDGNYTDKFSLLAIANNENNTHPKQIKLLNSFAFIWLILSSVLIVIDFVISWEITNNIKGHILMWSSCWVILYVNRAGYFLIAANLLIFIGSVSFFLFAAIWTPNIFAEFNLMFIPCMAIALFERKIVPMISLFVCYSLYTIVFKYIVTYGEGFRWAEHFVLFFSFYVVTNYLKTINQKNEKLLEKEKQTIKKQAKELKELNEFKSHFFINISHEIRTPLTLLKGYINKLKIVSENKSYIKIIKNNTEQIQQIVDSIIDLSRLDASKLPLHKTKIDFNAFVTKLYTDFYPLFEEKNITFFLDKPQLNVYIDADRTLLKRAITNLLTNALKFTPVGGNVSVIITLKQNLNLAIIDNGIGISNRDLNLIFNRYFQSENHITKSKGSGIGLALTKSILKNHGYKISVKSTPHVTTNFCIEISNNDFITSPRDESRAISKKVGINEKPIVLIVDDHNQMLTYIETILENDFEILKADNGKKAYEIINKYSIKLLITDYMMPLIDGYELVSKLKKQNIIIPIIVLTARQDIESKVKMLHLGIDAYIYKPFNDQELLLTAKYCINNAKERNLFLKENPEFKIANKTSSLFLKQLKEIVNDNIGNSNFSVLELADKLHLTERTLYRRTKAMTGCSPKEIILECRMRKARELYEEGNFKTHHELALAVGYKNTPYFIKKFKAYYSINLEN